MSEIDEIHEWRLNLIITGTISAVILLIQNFIRRLFNPAFEFFIFYLPFITSIIIYLKLRLEEKRTQESCNGRI